MEELLRLSICEVCGAVEELRCLREVVRTT